MDSFTKETDGVNQKASLENLQNILAKADALAAAGVPPETKAIFTIEGEEPQSADPSIPKSRLQMVLATVQQLPQETLSRQNLKDLLGGLLVHKNNEIPPGNEFNSVEIKIGYPENIKKLDELIKSFQKIDHCH